MLCCDFHQPQVFSSLSAHAMLYSYLLNHSRNIKQSTTLIHHIIGAFWIDQDNDDMLTGNGHHDLIEHEIKTFNLLKPRDSSHLKIGYISERTKNCEWIGNGYCVTFPKRAETQLNITVWMFDGLLCCRLC